MFLVLFGDTCNWERRKGDNDVRLQWSDGWLVGWMNGWWWESLNLSLQPFTVLSHFMESERNIICLLCTCNFAIVQAGVGCLRNQRKICCVVTGVCVCVCVCGGGYGFRRMAGAVGLCVQR